MIRIKLWMVVFLFLNKSPFFAQNNTVNLNGVTQTPVLSFCQSNTDQHNIDCFRLTLQNYIAERIKLPYDSLNNPIEGKAKAYLLFTKEGSLEIKAIRSKNKVLSNIAYKIFDDFPSFTPASIQDKPVSMSLVLPLNYTFSNKPSQYYSIYEVSPPQLKMYKKEKSNKELRRLYRDAVSTFISRSGYKSHNINGKKIISIEFEVDSLGNACNFRDLITSDTNKEKKLNDLALKKLSFKIPANIHGVPVKIKDTIDLLSVAREVKR